ncbi:MAG: metallophosphoesterase [Asgard group archaeon]|nr:metallophosphoesterase [Asgard group archaeon]
MFPQKSYFIPGKPALLLPTKEYGTTLVLADLHIGYVYGRNRRGIKIPYEKRPEEDIVKITKEFQPNHIIIVGDFKDEIYGAAKALVKRIEGFLQKIPQETSLTIIKGNHDGLIEQFLPNYINIEPPTGLLLELLETQETVGLWHGHAFPNPLVQNADITLSGHGHPAYTFRETTGATQTIKVWIKSKWQFSKSNKKPRNHIFMPAFNKYINGYPINEAYFESIINFKEALEFDKSKVFTLDGVLLGTLKELQEIKTID